jgi:D-lactate dehydrogenase
MKLFAYSMRDDERAYFDRFARQYGVEWSGTSDYPTEENASLSQGYDVVNIITNQTDRRMIDLYKANGVRCIATRTIGWDHIDIAYAQSVGIGVTNVSYSPDSVADYTIMLMLMGCRRMPQIMARAAVQDFSLPGKMGVELPKLTVGVVGTGRIGEQVIRHLQGFGCRILAYDLYPKASLAGMATYVALDELLASADLITLHCPGTPDNLHLIDASAFAKMKQGVMLVNAARGSLIDSAALIDALESGKVAWAGLDTVEHEEDLYYHNRTGEIIKNHPLALLRSYPNVLYSPHMAFYTDEAVSNMVEYSILAARDYLEGRPTRFLVNFRAD